MKLGLLISPSATMSRPSETCFLTISATDGFQARLIGRFIDRLSALPGEAHGVKIGRTRQAAHVGG